MKKYCFITILSFFVAGCSINEIAVTDGTDRTYYGSLDETMTKTFVDSRFGLHWIHDDRISIFSSTYNQQYRFSGETGANSGEFEIVPSQEFISGNDMDATYAVYPYDKNTVITDDGVMTINLPAEQSYAENTFGSGANTMVAVTKDSDDKFLAFKNTCGYLVIKMCGDATITEMTLKGNNGELLAGSAICTIEYGNNPQISISPDATETITLDCGEGVLLGKTPETATAFWFVIPPTTFSKGFTITYTTSEGKTFEKSTTKSRTITRNVVNTMNILKENVTEDVVKKPFTVNDISFNMVKVEPGSFLMSPDEVETTLTYTYYIGETEVTQELWESVMGDNPSTTEGSKYPVQNVTWNMTQQFIKALNALTDLNFRLPTEAEWEFAAKGGNKSKGYEYSGSDNYDEVAWFGVNSDGRLHMVGEKKANELGIYDMCGNILEWCNDYHSYTLAGGINPTGPLAGFDHINRGGDAWSIITSTSERNWSPMGNDYATKVDGLRLAIVLDGEDIIQSPENVIDLSENGTANSYMVSENGSYKFNASVRGNGNNPTGNISNAEVVWETFNSSSEPQKGAIVSNAFYRDGYIYFDASGTDGNALIAAKDDSGNILWSWHIWSTSYDPEETYDIYVGSESTPFMDRNLGALSDTPGDYLSTGFYYQWGRKDPFPASCDISTYTQIATVPDDIFVNIENTSATGTIEYAIANPTALLKENDSTLDWLNQQDHTLWGAEKTEYDPCPAGWKVPESGLFIGLCSIGQYTIDEYNGVVFGLEASTPEAYFPANGTMAGGSFETDEFAENCHYWTATINYDYFTSERFCIYEESSPIIHPISFRSHGFPIRCCRDNGL